MADPRNRFAFRLHRRQFAFVVEVIPPHPADSAARRRADELLREGLRADRIAGFAIGDRIRSDDDADAVSFAQAMADRYDLQPVVHVAGKDRGAVEILEILQRMGHANLQNALCMTGDRIKNLAREREGRVSYFDSVDMIQLVGEQAPRIIPGAVVNPFKPVPEDYANQILKLQKKICAGAEFVVAQIGFSWRRYRRLLGESTRVAPLIPVLAATAYLSPRIARTMHVGDLPGIVLPAALLAQIEAERKATDFRSRYARRLAIQILVLKAMGYAGVQVAAMQTRETLLAVLEAIAEIESQRLTFNELAALWDQSLSVDESDAAAPPAFAAPAAWRERARYCVLDIVDRGLFQESSPAARALGAVVRGLSGAPAGTRILECIEYVIKRPLVGCRLCGFCRLPHTMYVCPETCPKGLANGPCGGTANGMCEFGDRQCIHNQMYRIAAAVGRVHELATTIIPPVPEALRTRSSWITHFAGKEPHVHDCRAEAATTPRQAR